MKEDWGIKTNYLKEKVFRPTRESISKVLGYT